VTIFPPLYKTFLFIYRHRYEGHIYIDMHYYFYLTRYFIVPNSRGNRHYIYTFHVIDYHNQGVFSFGMHICNS